MVLSLLLDCLKERLDPKVELLTIPHLNNRYQSCVHLTINVKAHIISLH